MVDAYRIAPAEGVSEDARVADYDQLDEGAKRWIERTVEDGTAVVPAPDGGGLDGHDYVRFLRYYRIEPIDSTVAGDAAASCD